MGQPIVVVEKPSVANRGVVRFETNRALTGMGHEHYAAGEEVRGNRPPDELARRLLARGNVHGVHVNGSVVTVDLAKGHTSEGLKEIIESLYTFYPETDEAPEEAAHEGETDLGDAAAPEMAAEPETVTDEDADDAPAPVHEPAVPAEEAAAAVEAEEAATEAEAAAPDEEVPAEDAAPSADAVVAADEVSEAEVQDEEGSAPTVDQEPVSEEVAVDAEAAPAEDAPVDAEAGKAAEG